MGWKAFPNWWSVWIWRHMKSWLSSGPGSSCTGAQACAQTLALVLLSAGWPSQSCIQPSPSHVDLSMTRLWWVSETMHDMLCRGGGGGTENKDHLRLKVCKARHQILGRHWRATVMAEDMDEQLARVTTP